MEHGGPQPRLQQPGRKLQSLIGRRELAAILEAAGLGVGAALIAHDLPPGHATALPSHGKTSWPVNAQPIRSMPTASPKAVIGTHTIVTTSNPMMASGSTLRRPVMPAPR